MRVHRAVVRKDDHMFAVVANRILALGVDDDRAVMAHLLLQARMAVIPVGARLDDREFIDEGRPWADAGKADPGHAVELRRDQQPMPVDRAVLVEIVRYRQADGRSLLQPDERCRRSEEQPYELQTLMRNSYS